MISDTSFLIAFFLPEDELHDMAISKLKVLKLGDNIIISRSVLEETFTVLTYKRGVKYALNILELLEKNKNFLLLNSDENEWVAVINLAKNLKKKLSFVDYSVINLVLRTNEDLLCFDDELNKIVKVLNSR